MWGTAKASNGLFNAGRNSIGPFVLTFGPPIAVWLLSYTGLELGGDVFELGRRLSADPMATLKEAWYWPTYEAVAMVLTFAAFQIALMKLVPAPPTYGPITATGHRPEYTDNGLYCYFITLATFLLGSYGYGLFRPEIVYDNFGPALSFLSISALALCLYLQIKARCCPTTEDVTFSGNVLRDYYAGSELYPRICGVDVKWFTNCRFGMMSWPIIIISFAAKQESMDGLSDSMFVSVCLQLVYIAKFFLWEGGYMCSIDIMHDNAGFYLCWGCMVWVPFLYTIHAFWLVMHPVVLGLPLAATILTVGWTCIFVNYDADRQRAYFRKTSGKAPIWGSLPDKIVASYKTLDGKKKTNLLLVSGYWALARHFHYLPELGAAFCWSVPALFTHTMPYFYFLFLLPLLLDRSFRDEQRCSLKYTTAWQEYKRRVPARIVPGIF